MSEGLTYSQDIQYIAAMCESLPDMAQVQTAIIAHHHVDGDGGEQPFRFTFDFHGALVTLAWSDRDGAWGLEKLVKK